MAIKSDPNEYNFGMYQQSNQAADSGASKDPSDSRGSFDNANSDSNISVDDKSSNNQNEESKLNDESDEKSTNESNSSNDGKDKDEKFNSDEEGQSSKKSKIKDKSSKPSERGQSSSDIEGANSKYPGESEGMPFSGRSDLKDKAQKVAIATKVAGAGAKVGMAATVINTIKNIIQLIIAIIKNIINAIVGFVSGIASAIAGAFVSAASFIAGGLAISTTIATIMLAGIIALVPIAASVAAYQYAQDLNTRRIDGDCVGKEYDRDEVEYQDEAEMAAKAVKICEDHIGTKYNDGDGQSWENGVTSVGMIYLAYTKAGVSMETKFHKDPYCGEEVKNLKNAKPGDILFFATDDPKVKSVAILVDSETMIKSTKDEGVKKHKIDESKIEFIRRVVKAQSSDEVSDDEPDFSVTYIKNDSSNTKSTAVASRMYKVMTSSAGFTPEAACAVLGNIEQESSFDVDSSYAGGAARGLFQMEKGRQADMRKYCKEKTGDEWNVEAQTEWALKKNFNSQFKIYSGCNSYYDYSLGHEVKYSGHTPSHDSWAWWPKEKYDFKKFSKGTNIDELTEVFCRVFERASKPNMDNRRKYARKWYTKKTGLELAAYNSDIAYDQSDDGCGTQMKDKNSPSFDGPADELWFSQLAGSEWAGVEYVPGVTLGGGGCGIFSITHAIWLLGHQEVTPKSIIDDIKRHGMIGSMYVYRAGTAWGKLEVVAGWYGLDASSSNHFTADSLKDLLQSGGVAVVSSRGPVFKRMDGTFRNSGGHYICIYKYQNGNYCVKDSVVGPCVPYTKSEISNLLSAGGEHISIRKK